MLKFYNKAILWIWPLQTQPASILFFLKKKKKIQITLFIRKKHFVHDVNVRFQIPLLRKPLKTYHALKFTWHATLVSQMPFEQLFSVSAFVLTTAAVWTHSRLGFADLV